VTQSNTVSTRQREYGVDSVETEFTLLEHVVSPGDCLMKWRIRLQMLISALSGRLKILYYLKRLFADESNEEKRA